MLPCIGHTPAVLRAVHSLLQLVDVPQRFELLFSETFKLTANLLLFLLRPGLPKRRLDLLELVAHLILPTCQIAKPVKDLKILTLGSLLLRLSQAFRLVSILSLCKLQLLQLLLRTCRTGAAASAGTLILPNLMFALPQFEQLLVGRLLGRQCRRQFCCRFRFYSLPQMLQRCLHVPCRCLQRFGRGGIFGLCRSRPGLLQHVGLRLVDNTKVFLAVIEARLVGLTFYIPGCADYLLLQLRELFALPSALLLALLVLVLLVLGRLAFAEYLLEGAYFREVHITEGSADIAVRPHIVGPEVIRQQLIRLSAQFFQRQQVLNLLFVAR